jgi:hypothetical protein
VLLGSGEVVEKYEELGKGIVKRTQRRVVGVFIDGTGLDRAARRLNRRVDMAALLRGVTSGLQPVVARYYTLIPYEDDSRQRAFLDAVGRAGLQVVVKRLPPKGVTRQVSVDSEMASDVVAFGLGHTQFGSSEEISSTVDSRSGGAIRTAPLMPGRRSRASISQEGPKESSSESVAVAPTASTPAPEVDAPKGADQLKNRIVTIVCPSRDLAYPVSLVRAAGVDTITADFGQFNTGDVLKSAAKWIDLSDSETIWMA